MPQMDPQLVGPSGDWFGFHEGPAIARHQNPIERERGRARPRFHHDHVSASRRRLCEMRENFTSRDEWTTQDQSKVGFADGPASECLG